ncbi:uncharacterized protein LOC123557747 [Mercenaria mercenaria]|uniref:uncharacterized protein LOC123557747 n=1 Tax=Mercenaria mercenaria TaxID=6596 RepID=UPI00234E7DF3|nr:uncharacterized protein LOC123557747 [Mercenaria mercenaria]
MADRAGYDQPENKHISNYPTSREGTLPSYQAIGTQQQTGFVQPSVPYQSTHVVSHQPHPVRTVVIQTRPPDYLVSSVWACLFCFFPTGLFAIYYASRANTLANEGHYEEARRKSIIARNLLISSFVLGCICIITVTAILL